MRPVHIFYAVLISFCWGMNAPLVKMAVQTAPPFIFATLRCSVLALLVIFFPRPNLSWSVTGVFTVLHGVKISFLYYSLQLGLAAGISTVLLQTQILFTVFLSVLIFKELVTPKSMVGLFIAFSGVCIVGFDVHAHGDFMGMLFVISAAVFAACSFLVLRKHSDVNYLSFVGYFNLFSILPFVAAAYFVEGMPAVEATMAGIDLRFVLLLGCSALTVVGAYTLMIKLLSIYPTSQVAPYLLLIPIFGLTGGYVCLDEWCDFNELLGSIVIILGLGINQYGALRQKKHSG